MIIAHRNHIEVVGLVHYGAIFQSISAPYGVCYTGSIEVKRLSGKVDVLPFVVPYYVWWVSQKPSLSNHLRLTGHIRTRNKLENGRNRLIVELYVHKIENADGAPDANSVHLTGNICKPPTYRPTPSGREICDLILAVNHSNGKTDYIPCIAWGRYARKASKWKVGDTVKLTGRFQSREYDKLLPDGSHEIRTAYEVSASHINKKEG